MQFNYIYDRYTHAQRLSLYVRLLKICVEKIYALGVPLLDGFDEIEGGIRAIEVKDFDHAWKIARTFKESKLLTVCGMAVQDDIESVFCNILHSTFDEKRFTSNTILHTFVNIFNACDDPVVHEDLYINTKYYYYTVLKRVLAEIGHSDFKILQRSSNRRLLEFNTSKQKSFLVVSFS